MSGATATRAAAAATVPVARRYWVVTVGLTATLTAPSFAALRPATSAQVPPVRCWSSTGRTPRATPVRRVVDPYVTGPEGGFSDRTPTVNHVERKPSMLFSFAPATECWPPAVSAVIVVTRPDEFKVVWTSVTAPPKCSVRPSLAPFIANGPQLW